MNTINCRIKLNDHADVAGKNVTPAEIIVLRTLHDSHAGGCCILNPVAAGKALTFAPGEPGKPAAVRERTDAEEYMRLRKKYPMREAPDKPNSSFLDPLFPGVKTGTGKLPRSFDELPENYAVGAIGVPVTVPIKTQDKAEAVPVNEDDAERLLAESKSQTGGAAGNQNGTDGDPKTGAPTREELEKRTKDELLGLADDYQAEVNEGMKKAEIIDAILSKFTLVVPQ